MAVTLPVQETEIDESTEEGDVKRPYATTYVSTAVEKIGRNVAY